jgi:tRNA threonylcarbamoyl adenosine modification protein YeaZ
MSYILALDTTVGGFALALGHGHTVVGGIADTAPRSSSSLHPALETLLKQHDIKPNQIEKLAITVGPGSFTGCRIGVAFASAWQMAQPHVRVVGLPTRTVLAKQALALGVNEPFRVLMDAAGGQVYGQDFDSLGHAMAEAFCVAVAEAIDMPLPIAAAGLPLLESAKWHFNGITPEVLLQAATDEALHVAPDIVYLKALTYQTKAQSKAHPDAAAV